MIRRLIASLAPTGNARPEPSVAILRFARNIPSGAALDDGLGAWRNAMLHLLLTPSPLPGAGEVLVGISLPMFVAALIAAFGDRIRLSVGR